MSFFKKISLYFQYRNFLLKNKKQLQQLNIRIDRVNRIYTVINIPEDLYGEAYGLKTSDINKISEPYITEYIRQISSTLNKLGLSELYKLYDISKVDRYSYLLIIGFSFFDTKKMASNIFLKLLPAIIILSLSIIIILKLL